MSKEVSEELKRLLRLPLGVLLPSNFGSRIRDLMFPIVEIKTYEEETPKTGVREDSVEHQDPKAENNVGG
jgi:hypothetical protein